MVAKFSYVFINSRFELDFLLSAVLFFQCKNQKFCNAFVMLNSRLP